MTLKSVFRIFTAKALIVSFFGLVILFIFAFLLNSSKASAIYFPDLNVFADLDGYSAEAYPNNSIPITIQYTPEVGDLYKNVVIVPVISAQEPILPYSYTSWADDTDVLATFQIVQPTDTNTITLTFNQPLITRGANYIGCAVVRDDYSVDNYIYESSAMCYNSEVIVYTDTLLPIWRFYSSNYTSHFFTISHNEKMDVVNNDTNWEYEKPAFSGDTSEFGQTGNIALYRFWSKTKKSHFYTSNPQERDDVIRNYSDDVWKYEKIAFYIQPYQKGCATGTSPIYRFWSKTQQSHFYTKSQVERDEVINKYSDDVWRYEGPKFCAW